MPKPKFANGQAVTLRFDDGASYPATVFENIDAVCRPLTDMWRVRIEIDGKPGATFGFHGSHIEAR